MTRRATTGVDVALVVFNTLTPEEREEALRRMHEAHAALRAADDSEMARCIRSLRLVAERVGHTPGVEEYKRVSVELSAEGSDIEPFSRLYKQFDQNWARAREALELSETTTALRIDARFRSRRLGKVWRFAEPALRDALTEATAHYGRPPSVAEYDAWREHQLELAKARGDHDLQLPSDSPFRRRYGTWEAALLHFGYTPEEVELRLDNRAEFKFDPDEGLPEGLPVAELATVHDADLPLSPPQVERLRRAWDDLPQRSRYVLTVRLGLGVPSATLAVAAEPLGLTFSRIGQLQSLAIGALAAAVAGDRRNRPEPASLHAAVVETLHALTAHKAT